MDSLILETVIGLVFVFAVFASIVSVLTEMVARFLGLRGEYLLRGLRTLLDGGGSFSLNPFQKTSKPPAPNKNVTPIEPDNPLVTQLLTTRLLSSYADKGLMPQNAGNAKLSNSDRRKLPPISRLARWHRASSPCWSRTRAAAQRCPRSGRG